MWFDTWSAVTRVALVGAASYASLVVLLRLTGKRTLAKLNAFDLVVTVAFGSTLASVVLDSSVSWSEGVAALAALVSLQYAVAWTSVRLPGLRYVVTSEPTVLLRDGRPRSEALRRERVGMEELRQAARARGVGDLSAVAVIVLETDGSLSVVSRADAGDLSALGDLDR